MNQSAATYDYNYTASGVIRRRMRLMVAAWPVAQLSPHFLPPLDHFLYRVTRGRFTFSAWTTGMPVVVLTTKGARTGQPRTSRVLGIPDGDGFIVIAANFGQRFHPGWYYNLLADPQVSVVAGDTKGTFYARELDGDDRERGYQSALSMNPAWPRYQERAGKRVIPVFRLDAA
jgi:deazaflavin-dependent oxidoreductase (nitroreductase family)